MAKEIGNVEKQKIRANIWKMYGYWFGHGLIFAYVIERLFGLERGLTVQQMVYLEVIYCTFTLFLEVPTGALADSWSRRKSMILAGIFTFFEFFILIFAQNFWVFALSTVAAGTQHALASGTSNAIFYESLQSIGEEGRFERVIARNKLLRFVSGGIAALLGGVMATLLGLTSTYWFSLLGVVASIFFAISLYEPKVHLDQKEESYFAHIKEAFDFLRQHKGILFVTLYSLVVGSLLGYLFEYWQNYLAEIQFPVALFGAFSLLLHVLVSVPGLLAPKVKERIGYRLSFSLVILLGMGGLLLASYLPFWGGLIPLVIAFMAFGLVDPLFAGYLHHQIDSKSRATIESFTSLALMPVSILVGLIFGWVTTRYDIFGGVRFLGLLALVYGVYYLVFQFKYVQGIDFKNPEKSGIM